MKNFSRALPLTVLLFLSVQMMAQDTHIASHSLTVTIPEVALLDIEPASNSVTLGATVPTEAGEPLDFTTATNTALWLNYSSIIGTAPDNSRAITVSVAGTLPTGANLKVQAGSYSGSGAGTTGTSAGEVTLATVATDYSLVTGIGSCYTGDGESNGHQLSYSLTEDAGNYASLNFSTDYSLTVTYTLSDN